MERQLSSLPQPPGLSLRLQQGQDVSLSHGALDISDDLSVLLSDELNFHLGTLTLGTGSAQNLDDTRQLDFTLHSALISCRSESSNISLVVLDFTYLL